eukprot:CAMPEP_0180797196 /NCGR_PEP_ID=MMETSP1038_2-20121128/57232_1 /TAXON_ID=632150 /ORGANISM="Azadinium spinosum, Strain 3D9" /LENGTH=33 /DNA_ID= /DNA_START= /DNA_END= /DNA_ORIENTATION=
MSRITPSCLSMSRRWLPAASKLAFRLCTWASSA